MTDTDRLLSEFIQKYRGAGDADPLPFLRRAGDDRPVLAALIDGFLAAEPAPPFDPHAFAVFRATPGREQLVERVLGPEPTLTQLRREVGLEKAEVGERLAERFGLSGRSASAKACYHEIETGQVPPARVRDDVWAALGDIFGRARDVVLDAAATAFEGRVASAGAFARESGPAATAAPDITPPQSDPVRSAFFYEPE